ncbi:response regulator [Propionivibrio sp.]|uniref:response regulator n=1 Tax=Propionivibrio sp. TaxID=2212460 RepID=UPI0025D3C98B|nr:response regulator [Propionivibrio sp.]MBK7357262.1 response regulator [Propionivibrio sp.]MBK8401341.1 response regulator [Propionivibrio sp.]MBK8745989.1 response regulator [Propionivibrio sp.]MBK8892567.1 response regulator [Propionivibrio sp.]MBL0208694.1 response regulator [Propionivibrio sp.]
MGIFNPFRSILGKTESVAQPPIAAPQPQAGPSVPVERRSRKRLNSHLERRVLIIDDSATIVAALRKMLRSAGCVTLEAMDAEKGLEMVLQEKPELVFLDIVLPGMNGFAALRLMRRNPLTRDIPVIMISGNEQATEQFYAKRIGADDFMKKPFSRYEVFARIDALIESNKLRRLYAGITEDKPVAAAASS